MQELWNEEESDNSCTNQVQGKHIENIRLSQYYEIYQVQRDVHYNEKQLQRSKLYSILFISEVGKRYCLNSIQTHYAGHHQNKVLTPYITHKISDSLDKDKYKSKENH